MTGTLLALMLFVVVGYPVARVVAARREIAFTVALSLLAGTGLCSIALLLLDNFGIRWSRIGLILAAAVLSALFAAVTRRWRADLTFERTRTISERLVWVMLLVVSLAHARFATLIELVEWDYVAMWGLKARSFLGVGGIDWEFLQRPESVHHNVDYPPLMNFIFDTAALLSGTWEHRWIGLFFTAYGVAAFVIAWFFVRRAGLTSYQLPAAVLLMFVAFSDRIGLAEGPFIAFSFAAIALLREGMRLELLPVSFVGGTMLGFAAFTKNEGLTLIMGAAFAIVVAFRWRHLPALLPAVVIAAWWQILRAVHHLPTARASGDALGRIRLNLANYDHWASALREFIGKPLFWLAVVVLIVMAGWRTIWRERFFATVVLTQLAFICAAYLMSHVDIHADLQYSWERVTHQLALPVAFLAVVVVATVLRRTPENEERA